MSNCTKGIGDKCTIGYDGKNWYCLCSKAKEDSKPFENCVRLEDASYR